ncbi:MAG: metallophosphoesterase [Clostridia bacterium]|nr:metallophosphoesterase [Clostridia bacterium]
MITSESLKKTLGTKIPLNFGSDGKFRVLLFSDIQCEENGDPRTLEAMEKIVADKMPDLVLWGGDNPHSAPDRESFLRMIGKFAGPMESRNIPWALTYGNHDDVMCTEMTVAEVEKTLEEEFPCCVSKTVEGIHGVSNYVLPVYSAGDKEKIALNIFSLDTGRKLRDLHLDCDLKVENIREAVKLEEAPLGLRNGFDIIRFDQLMWYWNTSSEIEKENGKTPAIMLTHYCPHEHIAVKKNPEATEMTGEFPESISPGAINPGLFATVLQRGDVMGMYFGHNHRNSAEGKYCGIRLGYIGCIGFDAYGFKSDLDSERHRLRGARLLTFDESDIENYTSEFILASDYIEFRD